MQKSPGQDLRGAVMNMFPSAFKDMVKKERNFEDIPVSGKVNVPCLWLQCSVHNFPRIFSWTVMKFIMKLQYEDFA